MTLYEHFRLYDCYYVFYVFYSIRVYVYLTFSNPVLRLQDLNKRLLLLFVCSWAVVGHRV